MWNSLELRAVACGGSSEGQNADRNGDTRWGRQRETDTLLGIGPEVLYVIFWGPKMELLSVHVLILEWD